MRAFSGTPAPGLGPGIPHTGLGALTAVLLLFAAAGAVAEQSQGGLRKRPPDSVAQAYGERLSALIEQRYPELSTGKRLGTPVVTVLFDYDGTVAGTHLEFVTEGAPPPTASAVQFARFGIRSGRLKYMGVVHVQLRTTAAVVILGTEDSSDLDRMLVERLFPNELTRRSAPNNQLWILFDHEGRVLRFGEDPIAADGLRRTLEARFPGIRTADMTTSAVFGADGRPLEDLSHHRLELACVWLSEGSAHPAK